MSSSRRGVTLIELLMVMALIGIIMTITFPSMQPLISKQTLKSDANKMAWTLRSARQKAITTGEAQEVEFKPYTNKYEYNGEEIELSDGIRYVGNTSFQAVGNRRFCSFTSQGIPSHSGKVTLKDKHQHIIYIIVNPVGGRVRVSTEPPIT